MQYGGGEREDSFGELLEAFFDPSSNDNLGPGVTAEFGNQIASFTSQFVLGEPFPVAVYFEYAGEDTSRSSNFRLGNSALSAGIAFPKLGRNCRRRSSSRSGKTAGMSITSTATACGTKAVCSAIGAPIGAWSATASARGACSRA